MAETRTIKISVGDKLQLRASRQRDKVLNGQIVTVKSVREDGHIELDDGRQIPLQFKAFAHGYAVTSYGSQSKTVDHVYVAVDSHSLQSANRKMFYVSLSRGRERGRIFTDDLDFLREAVMKSGTRQAATELLNALRMHPAQDLQPKARHRVRI